MCAVQRQKNLDAFLSLAVEHEKHAAVHHDPGTLTGFLLWLEHPSSPDLDLQPVVTTGDAVHVLTYHRAKGLEWPLVVCTDFDYEPLPRTWDVRVELTGTRASSPPTATPCWQRHQKTTGRTETQSFKVSKSKPIIDEIGTALAPYYGFTAEELDFIINYDIKYRLS